MKEIQEINWRAIVSKIKKNKCVLILGPDIYLSKTGKTHHKEFLKTLNIEENKDIQKYYKDDNLFLFNVPAGKAFTCDKIEDYYKKAESCDSLNQLVKIPFHLILNITPDKILKKVFESEEFQHQFYFHKKTPEEHKINNPSQNMPLIYNLFGCIDDEESLILTHNDLFDYFKSLFEQKSMPKKLRETLKNKATNCYIFLGVPFDKWYLQLLLRELEIHLHPEDFIRYASNNFLSGETKIFCNEQFTIQFIDHNIPEFVDTLFQHCQKEGILRSKSKGSSWNDIKNTISLGNLREAIGQVKTLAEGSDFEDESIAISSRYRSFERKKRNGVLDTRDISLQENQIIGDLLDLIHDAENS